MNRSCGMFPSLQHSKNYIQILVSQNQKPTGTGNRRYEMAKYISWIAVVVLCTRQHTKRSISTTQTKK